MHHCQLQRNSEENSSACNKFKWYCHYGDKGRLIGKHGVYVSLFAYDKAPCLNTHFCTSIEILLFSDIGMFEYCIMFLQSQVTSFTSLLLSCHVSFLWWISQQIYLTWAMLPILWSAEEEEYPLCLLTLTRIFHEKLIVQKLSASYEIWRLITMFTKPVTDPYLERDVFPFIMLSDPSCMDLWVNVSSGRR